MFYTFVDRSRDRIFHRYIDDQGNRRQEVVSDFEYEAFVKSPNGTAESLYGDKLRRHTFNGIPALNAFVKEMEGLQPVFGMLDPVGQFIAKTYPGQIEFDATKFRTVAIDIETRFDGYDPQDVVTVRKTFSEEIETKTVAWVRDNWNDTYEVYDAYSDKWYPIAICPQHNPGGFPDPQKAEYEVTSVSLKIFGKNTTLVVGSKDFKETNGIIHFRLDTESELLKKFVEILRDIDPDIITGWNIDGFDIPYLINRIRLVLGDAYVNMLSPFWRESSNCVGEAFSSQDGNTVYKILGVSIFDYLTLYKGFNPVKQERYSLDFIAEQEGVGNKVDYSEYGNLMELYKQNYQKFILYNVDDSRLVERLDDLKQFVLLGITIAMKTHSRLSDIHGKIAMWDNLIYNLGLADNKVIPPKVRGKSGSLIGAYVKEPIPGMYRWVASLDLTSLYPSIVMMFNMSPETMVSRPRGGLSFVNKLLDGENLAEDAKANGHCMVANGAVFRQDSVGVIPRAMRYVFDARRDYKKQMLAAQSEAEKLKAAGESTSHVDSRIAALNAAQNAMKIIANSGYGILASAGFRYFDNDIAEGITLTGQLGIQYIGRFINQYLNERFGKNKDWVITSDTDSCYITLDAVPTDPTNVQQSLEQIDRFIHDELQPAIDKAYGRLAESLGAKQNLFDMKREAISNVAFWRGKKNYAMMILDNEGVRFSEPKLKILGLEPVRSDRPMIVRAELTECIKTILNGTVEELRERVKAFEPVFKEAGVKETATPKGCNGISEYSSNGSKKTIPGHVRAAMIFNRMVSELGLDKTVKKIRDGDKVRVIQLKTPNPAHHHTIAFLDDLPTEFGLDEFVDYNEMYNKAFMVPVESYCKAVDWQLTKTASFEDLW